jgi:hypothetical protein
MRTDVRRPKPTDCRRFADSGNWVLVALLSLFAFGCTPWHSGHYPWDGGSGVDGSSVDGSSVDGSGVDGGGVDGWGGSGGSDMSVHTPGCPLVTCASAGAQCGPVGDGCGNAISCGGCALPETCGGGGTSFVCGGSAGCIPRSCASASVNCGPFSDGCGGLLDCGSCAPGETCGTGGPNICGGTATTTCNNLCLKQVSCDGGASTTLSGTVVAGTDPARFGAPDPIYNALVYVPNGTVQPFGKTVSCSQCGATASGSPLVKATTNVEGKFQLTNVPCGTDINLPLVIQLGRWRRQIIIKDVACCANTMLSPDQTRLPRNQREGDIPKMALATGNVDALECVLRKMGIDDSEFTDPTGNGRVSLYQANGATLSASTPNESQLVGNSSTLQSYDMVLFPCEGSQKSQSLAYQQNIIDYTNAGGRVFATHFSYAWLVTAGSGGLPGNPPAPQPFVGTGSWHLNQVSYDPFVTGMVDTSFPKGQALSSWLVNVGAATKAGQIPVQVVRRDLDSVVAPSQRWLSSVSTNTTSGNQDPDIPVLHYTFNTPVGAAASQQCGRVVFSDFHVEDASNTSGKTFPAECGGDKPLTPQEKLLEFMLLDLASCVAPDTGPPPVTCTPLTCQELNASCGIQGDGCGKSIDCGACPYGQSCGGGGVLNKCGAPQCTPRTCAQVGAHCGVIGDGCGGIVNCGSCPTGQTCGGGGIANACGTGRYPT